MELKEITYWNTRIIDNFVGPPEILSGEFFKGDDIFEYLSEISSLVLLFTNSEHNCSRGLNHWIFDKE